MKNSIEKTILVVDDDEAVQSTIKELLEFEGYRILVASDGQSGLRMLLADGIHVDLIILDLYMPHMDGWQFAHYLKKYGSNEQRKIPIVITSGTDRVTDADMTLMFQGFLHKPFTLENLLTISKEYCK